MPRAIGTPRDAAVISANSEPVRSSSQGTAVSGQTIRFSGGSAGRAVACICRSRKRSHMSARHFSDWVAFGWTSRTRMAGSRSATSSPRRSVPPIHRAATAVADTTVSATRPREPGGQHRKGGGQRGDQRQTDRADECRRLHDRRADPDMTDQRPGKSRQDIAAQKVRRGQTDSETQRALRGGCARSLQRAPASPQNSAMPPDIRTSAKGAIQPSLDRIDQERLHDPEHRRREIPRARRPSRPGARGTLRPRDPQRQDRQRRAG